MTSGRTEKDRDIRSILNEPPHGCNGVHEATRTLATAELEQAIARARDGSPELLTQGTYRMQVDFTEGRLAVKIDPSGEFLHRSI
jgi:hypothetical protein